MSRYSIPGYRIKLQNSRNATLLVEGPKDKRLFQLLLRDYPGGRCVTVDSAAILDSPPDQPGLGNRGKVEAVCSGLTVGSINFAGFVDREFREFDDSSDALADSIQGHRTDCHIVWSRGHSVENYYFDPETLHEPLRALSTTDTFDKVLELFDTLFDSSIRLSYSISLAGRDVGYTTALCGTLSWNLLDLDLLNNSVILNVDKWRISLTRMQLGSEDIDRLIDQVGYWHRRVMRTDARVVRWGCHGHLGLTMIWNTYARCVLQVTGMNNEASKALATDERLRFNACAEAWARNVLLGKSEYPQPVIDKLGLKRPG